MTVTILALLLCVLTLPAADQDDKSDGDVARVPGWARFTTAATERRHILRKTFAVEVFCRGRGGEEHLERTADYPQFTPDSPANHRLNQVVEENVLAEMLERRFESCTQDPSDPPGGEKRRTYTKHTSCEDKLVTSQFASIRCQSSTEGYAHPASGVGSLNLDRKRGTVIPPAELFLPSRWPRVKRSFEHTS